jgi:hypothetical protein
MISSPNFLPCVEAGYNTSTVALRVVRGDERGTQCPGYNWDTLFLDLALQVEGVSNETVKYGREIYGTWLQE